MFQRSIRLKKAGRREMGERAPGPVPNSGATNERNENIMGIIMIRNASGCRKRGKILPTPPGGILFPPHAPQKNIPPNKKSRTKKKRPGNKKPHPEGQAEPGGYTTQALPFSRDPEKLV